MSDTPSTPATASEQRLERARAFIGRVRALDRGELAVLKRNAGNTLAESRGASWFYRLLDEDGRRQDEIHFLVATLMGLNKHGFTGDFGRSMAMLASKGSSEAVERRFRILLDATFDDTPGCRSAGGELAFRLRQMAKLAASKEVGIDWAQLLVDLQFWNSEHKRVQKKWAESFYTPPVRQENTSD